MQAVILAAGRGDRLGRLGRQVPKCLLRVGRMSLIEHVAEALVGGANVTQLVLVVSPAGRPAISAVAARVPPSVSAVGIVDAAPRGEMGSLQCASEYLEDAFLVSDANILYGPELAAQVLSRHASLAPFATVGISRDVCEARTHVRLAVDGDYASLPPAPNVRRRPSEAWIYTGVGAFSRSIVELGEPSENLCGVMARCVANMMPVAAVQYSGFYGHVATAFCLGRTRQRWSAAHAPTSAKSTKEHV